MARKAEIAHGIPVAVSLAPVLEAEHIIAHIQPTKKRILFVSLISIVIAVVISFIAKFLVYLINGVTNISFYGQFSVTPGSPQHNHLGLWVILIPVAGGAVVGLMALYGSKAIRGHGIPEAMEQILTNDSKIKPAITYLKPLSSAIAIGTGGPFGAEGPIIATGGALGSTIGQLLKISHYERKVLLAAGATAGMSAIFGSPIAAIFLAIELLLFEFSPNSIIPVALACITGAAGHRLLFDNGPVFAIAHTILPTSNQALFVYCIFGAITGILAVGVTKIVYLLEDIFEKLPIHWAWWPATGGLFVGVIGYFNPRTLGVGYSNITDVLSGSLTLQVIVCLCLLKFASWAIALASGTSGGTLAPLLTIGGSAGAIMGMATQHFFPQVGISVSLAALVGMSAMFAGASRALLTSIIFALETTGEANALLPLLGACTIAYFISLYLMENTIMTEKIARRGVKAPETYKADILEEYSAGAVMTEDGLMISDDNNIAEAREWVKEHTNSMANYFIIVNNEGVFSGLISSSNLFSEQHDMTSDVGALIKRKAVWIKANTSLRTAVELMVNEDIDLLPVVNDSLVVIGIISYKEILNVYKRSMAKHVLGHPAISIKRRTMKLLLKRERVVTLKKRAAEGNRK